MNKIKHTLKRLWQDESGQGATEYILILVVVVTIVIVFKDNIMDKIKTATTTTGQKITGAISTLSTTTK